MIRALALALMLTPGLATAQDRILAVGGSVTEILYALGAEDRLVGRDSTSTYPAEAMALPDVGYMRALSPEGVLSVDPELIVAEEGAGPAEVVDVLRSSGIEYAVIPEGYTREALRAKIMAVGAAIDENAEAAALASKVDAALAEAMAQAQDTPPKRVLFILSMQGGRIMAAGQNTAADGILTLAGAENAIQGFEGYKPLTDEAISAADPEMILMMDRGGDHGSTDADLWANPAIATTRAARDQAVLRMDGLLLLGFGPRTPDAVTRLHDALYGG